MIQPTFLDTHEPIEQSAFSDRFGGAAVPTGMQFGTSKSSISAKERQEHFTYWNYIAVDFICKSFASQMPIVGRPVPKSSGRGMGITAQQRVHMRRHYPRPIVQEHEDFEPLDSHILIDLLHSVNPVDTWGEFAYETCMFWHLTNKFYWWALPMAGFGMPAELWVFPTNWVKPIWSRSNKLTHYEIRSGNFEGGKVSEDLPPEEILEGKFKSPISKFDGWGPMDAAPRWMNNTEFIERSRTQSYQDGVVPSVWFKLGERYSSPTNPTLKEFQDRLMQKASGFKHHRQPQFIPPDIEIQQAQMTPHEMDYLGSAEQVRDDTLALWTVPSALIVIGRDVNRATVEASHEVFCSRKMNPLFALFSGILTEKLAPLYGSDIVIWYEDCTPANWDEQLRKLEQAFRSGGASPDEIAVAYNREPMETIESKSRYIPAGMIPLDPELAQPLEDEDDDDGSEEADTTPAEE